jgi:hypothetical protein
MTPEARVLSAARFAAKSRGAPCLRLSFRPGVSVGWPDLLILGRFPRLLFMECKRPGAKVTPLQLHVMDVLNELGWPTVVVDTPDAARAAVASALGPDDLYAPSRRPPP